MKIGAFTIDTEKLAQGMFQMSLEHPNHACLVLGMVPAEIVKVFERELKKRVPDLYLCNKTLQEFNGKEQRKEMMSCILARVYELAQQHDICKLD
jgi:hypothetical protein